MKSFKRRALAFVVTAAMVLTSLVVPAFAASNEIDATGLTAAEDGKSYYSGTLKYEYAGGTVDLAALPSGSGYDASYNNLTTKAILFFESFEGTGHRVQTTAEPNVTINSAGVATIDSINFSSSDIVDDLFNKSGEYSAYIRILKDPTDFTAGGIWALESTNSIKVIPDIKYPEPVITKDAVGGNWEFEVDIPADTFGEAVLMVQPAGGTWAKIGGWRITTTGTNTITSTTAVNAGDKAYVALQLYDRVIGSLTKKYYVPVDWDLTTATPANGGRNVRSAIVTAGSSTPTPAAPTAAPEFVDVNGNVPASDGKIYVKQATDYDVKLVENAADTGKTLPDKTVTYGTTTVSADPTTGIATLAGVLPAAANTYSLVAAYDGVAALTNTIDLVVRDKAELTVSPNYYMSAAGVTVSGTSPEVDGEITVTFADSHKEILAVDAAGNWSVTVPFDAAKVGAATVKVENIYTGYTATENTTVALSTVADITATIDDTTNYTLNSGAYDTYATDNFPVTITAAAGEQVKVTLDSGTPVTYTSTGTDIKTVSNGSAVAAGVHTITVEYATAAGASATVKVNVLTSTPDLSLVVSTTPVQSKAGMVIEGTVEDGSAVAIYDAADHKLADATVTGTAWTATVDLSGITPGAAAIYAKATKVSKTQVVDIDVTAAPGTLGFDLTGFATDGTNYYVANTADLSTPITVKVTGIPGEEVKVTDITSGGSTLSDTVTLDAAGKGTVTLTPGGALQFIEGEIELKVEYTSPMLTGTATAKVVLDITAPTVAGYEVDDDDTSVTLTSEKGFTASYTIDGENYSATDSDNDGEVTIGFTGGKSYKYGKAISVTVTDLAGNTTTKTGTVQATTVGAITLTFGSADYTEYDGKYYTKVDTNITFTINATAGKDLKIELDGVVDSTLYTAGSVTLPAPSGTPFSESEHTIVVSYDDSAYSTTTATAKVVVDKTAPEVTTITGIDDTDTSLEGKVNEAGAYVTAVNNATGVLIAGPVQANASGNWSMTIAPQAAGTVINVTAFDVAGNTDSAKDKTTTVGTSSLVGAITITADDFTNDNTKFELTIAASKNINVYVDGVKVVADQPAGDFTILPGDISKVVFSDGTYVIKAEYVDTAYADKTVTKNIVVDTIKPASATINEVDDQDTAVTGTAEAGATVEAFVNAGVLTSLGSTTADSLGNYSISIAKQAAGTQIVVRVTDPAGNMNATDAATTVVISLVSDIEITTDAYTNNQTQLEITVTAETGKNINLYVNGAKVRDDVPAGAFTVLASEIPGGVLSEGTYVVKAEYVDPAYASKTVTKDVVVDITAPAAAVINTVTDSDTTVTGTAEAGATVEVFIGGATAGTVTVASDGTWSKAITAQAAGTVITAKVTDPAGNVSAAPDGTTTVVITPSVTAPVVTPAYTEYDGKYYSNNTTQVKFNVSGTAGMNINAYINTLSVVTNQPAGDFTYTEPLGVLPEGEYTIKAEYVAAGYTAGTATLVIDTTAPAVATINDVDDQDTEITGTAAAAEAGATVKAYVDGTQVGTDAIVAADGSWTITGVTPLEVGKVITVKITDLAGNQNDTGNKATTVVKTPKANIVITADAYTNDDTKLSFDVAAEAGELLKVYATGLTGPEQLIYSDKTAGTIDIPVALIPGANLDDGVYNVRVTYAKAAYEDIEDTAAITVDTEAPAAADVEGLDAIYDDDTTATITLTNDKDKGATVALTIGTDNYTGTDTDNDGVISITIDKHLVDIEISAVVTDLAGNASAAITGNKVLKRDGAQAITVTTADAYLSRPTTMVYTVDAEAGRPIEATISKDGGAAIALATPIIGANTIEASVVFHETYFAEGEYVITVKYADPAYPEKTGTVTVTVINDAPTPAILDPATGDNETTEITGKVDPAKAGLTAYVEINSTTYEGAVDAITGEFTIDITGSTLEVGDVLEVMVKDAAGNVAAIPASYTSHKFTVTAKDIAKIVLTPDLTFDTVEGKYFADNTEVLPAIKVAVDAQAGYDVKVTIAGPNADTTFNATTFTITGSGDVLFTYNSTVAGYGFAPVNEYTVSAEYVKVGFDDKAADDVTVAVVEETAEKPVIDEITDRDLTITGTNEAFATVEVSFDNGATWVDATIDSTDNTKWSYSLTDSLTAGDKVLARQTLKGGKVSENAEATVVFEDVISVELDYGTDCALGTTHDTDKFDITLKADKDRKVIVTVKHVQANGIEIIPDGWDAKEITADGTVQTFTVERDSYDTHYEEGEWVVTAEYKDKAAMEAQGNLTGALEDTLTVMVIGNPEAPTLVAPNEVTNRTTEITVEMGDFAKTAKVYADGADITSQVTVTALTGNEWKIELPMQLAGTELKITEVDTSDVESADALEITVAYDSNIAIEITATSVDTDRVADLHADGADLVISGTTTDVLDGTEVTVTVVSEADAAYKLTPVTTTVTSNAWSATFTYDAAAFSGLLEGTIIVTATLDDEKTPDKLTDTVEIVNDKTTPDAPIIVGSNIDGTDVAGKLTTRSTELYGTAAGEADGTVTVVVYDENDAPVGTPLTTTVGTDGSWRVTFAGELKVGYSVEVTVTDLADHTSAAATLDVTTAAVQKYELTIDELTNPYVNTLALANGNETDGVLTFTGTTTAHDTDKVLVTINVIWGGASFTKEATVSGGVWTVTFGDDTTVNTLIKKLSDTTLTPAERTEGLKIRVTAAYAEEGITVSDDDTTNNEIVIYPDSTAPTAPEIINEPVYNRATVIKVKSTTDYRYGTETPADHGEITLYADGVAITPTATPQFDFATKTWTIDIDALNKDVVLTATETDMAGNESELSVAKTVVEAIEGEDEDAGEVKELLITDASEPNQYIINGEKVLYVNNVNVTSLTISGEGANEKVRVSFKNLDNGNNADTVFTTAKEFTISGNAWSVDLQIGALINTLPENRYEFKIEYLNTTNTNPEAEGVIGEDTMILVIDNQAPEALTVNTAYDRDLTISGGKLATYPDAPENYELWFKVENADGTVRSDWAQLDRDKVTNIGGEWKVNKADLGLESGIRKELGTKVSFLQVDRASNESVPVATTIVELTNQGNIDAADIKIISPANNATVARGTTQITIKGKAEPNERISVKIDDVHEYTVDEMTVNADGTWEVTFGNATTAEFTVGTHRITAKYLDIRDNVTGELYAVTSIFKVPAETKPSTGGGGGGGGSASWDDITVTEETVAEGTKTLTGKGEKSQYVLIYFKDKADTANGMGTLIGRAKVDSEGVWKIEEASEEFIKLEAGEYIINATYDLGNGSSRGKYVDKLTITAKDPADNAYVLFTVGSHEYKVDGIKHYADVAPYIDGNDRTMLPLRAFANALSISDEDISWDDATKTATIVRPDGKKVVVQVGRNVIVVNGVETVIDTIPVIKDSRVFLPLRAMLNAFGIADSRIVWNADKGQVIIVQDAKLDLQALVDAALKAEDTETEE